MAGEALKEFERVVAELRENPFQPQGDILKTFLASAIDVYNEEIAGEVELEDGTIAVVQPIIQ